MAYSNLTTFCSALASYGKNFQQYLDGHPSLTVRQAAGTDLAELALVTGNYYGSAFTNLSALAVLLSKDNEVQDELSHTTLSMRNAARTEWTQLVSTFGDMETDDGLTPGDYSAATAVVDAILAAGMPNDLGQWSDKLTTSQMANGATAIAAMGTAVGNMPNAVFYKAIHFWRPDRGMTWVGTGTSDTGTGTDDEMDTWTDDVNGLVLEQTTGYGTVLGTPYYSADGGPDGGPCLIFRRSESLSLSAGTGGLFDDLSKVSMYIQYLPEGTGYGGLINIEAYDRMIYDYSGGRVRSYCRSNTDGAWTELDPAYSTGSWYNFAYKYDDSWEGAARIPKMWKDGAFVTPARTLPGVGALRPTAGNRIVIGQGPETTYFLNGMVARVGVWDDTLSDDELDLITT